MRVPGPGPKGEGGTRWGVGTYGRHMHWQRGKRDYKLVKIAADPNKKKAKKMKRKKKIVTKPNNGPKLALALPLGFVVVVATNVVVVVVIGCCCHTSTRFAGSWAWVGRRCYSCCCNCWCCSISHGHQQSYWPRKTCKC